jgi:hypothetical protein
MSDAGNTLQTAADLNILTNASVAQTLDQVDTADYFRFKILGRSSVSLQLTGLNADANLSLIRDNNRNGEIDPGEVLFSSNNNGRLPELISLDDLEPGIYHIGVRLGADIPPPEKISYALRANAQSNRVDAVLTDSLATRNSLFWQNESTGNVTWWRLDGKNLLETRTINNPNPNQHVVGWGDFNGDRRADVVWQNLENYGLQIWQPNFTTTTTSSGASNLLGTLPPEIRVESFGDFNGDGKTDIFWRNYAAQKVGFWLSNATGLSSDVTPLSTVVSGEEQLAGIGDLDGDGKQDLIWRNLVTRQVSYWLMDGATVRSSSIDPTLMGSEWSFVGAVDLNRDRKADFVWRNTATQDVAFWTMNGVTKLATSQYGLPMGWQIRGLADLDGDGDRDVVWQNGAAQQIAFWLMDGTGIQAGVVAPQAMPGDFRLDSLADLNADGKVDLVWRLPSTGEIRLWIMNGSTVADSAVINSLGTAWTNWLQRPRYERPNSIDAIGDTLPTALNMGEMNGRATYSNVLTGLTSQDIYKFTISSFRTLSLNLSEVTGDVDIQLLNSAGAVIQSSSGAGLANERLTLALGAGEYYIRVFAKSGVSTGNPTFRYTLNASAPLQLRTRQIADWQQQRNVLHWNNG